MLTNWEGSFQAKGTMFFVFVLALFFFFFTQEMNLFTYWSEVSSCFSHLPCFLPDAITIISSASLAIGEQGNEKEIK